MQKPTKLMNKNFYLLWQAQSISSLGAQGFAVAIMLWITHATNSATLVGLVLMLSAIPAIVISPFGGAFADRHSRKKILIVCNLILTISLFSLVSVFFIAPERTNLILVWMFIVSISVDTVTAFFAPAFTASIPDLVPPDKVMSANSLSQLTIQLAVFIGQGIGGTLYRLIGAPILFLVNGITYLFSFASNNFITIPQEIPETTGSFKGEAKRFLADILEGLKYVWKQVGLRNMVLVSAVLSFFSVPITVLMAFFVKDTLHATDDWYGYILAAYGVGSMLGYVFAGAFKKDGVARGRTVMAFMLIEAFGYAVLALSTSAIMATIMASIGGFLGGFVNINIITLLQIYTPQDMRGRVFGLLTTISGAASPLAMGLSGVVADLLEKNIPIVYIGCGVIMGLFMLYTITNKEFRAFLYQPNKEIPAQELQGEMI